MSPIAVRNWEIHGIFAELAHSFNTDTDMRATLICMPDSISFTLLDKSDNTIKGAYIDLSTTMDQARDIHVGFVDLLDYQTPEDYKLSSDQQHESQRRYYEKYGTKNEF